ncbi:MAG: NAD(P)-dependent oxidoreductase [Deltaproteobacteria bacterium]
MSVRILFCGTGWLDIVPRIEAALSARGVDARVSVRDAGLPLRDQLGDIDVVLPSNCRFGADDLAAAPRLALIQQPAVGHEGIDIAAARARGVPVCNAPGSNTDSVAQAALLLALALARRFRVAQTAFARGTIGSPLGMDLSGRTLGVVGMGRTGSRLAEIARAIGMNVSSVGRTDGPDALLALLGRADVVSLHAPLTERTKGLLDDRAFATMKPGALLVNVARGGLVDRGALERALASGRLGGVGLDVFWEEPWDPRDPLFARDDVVVLPHVAGSTEESFARIADIVATNIAALVAHEPLVHRVDLQITSA